MGKKHVVKKTEEEVLKEKEKIDKRLQKDVKVSKKTREIEEARVYISSSYNNTLVTLADMGGNVLGWRSAGSIGFKGTKKGTSFAATRVGEAAANICKKFGIKKIHVSVKGIGAGRESAIRALAAQGLKIMSIKDITPIPHNGCRPRKARRV